VSTERSRQAFLARIERRAPPPRGAAGAPDPGLPEWLRSRLEGTRARAETLAETPALGRPRELLSESGPAGPLLVRRERLGGAVRHGFCALDAALAGDRAALARVACDPALERADLGRAVFLDIETNGLAGGAGTLAFLVALGWFEGREFVLWQGFLERPSAERALLAAVAARIQDAALLVSYFGKSFDRHRLEDKMRLHGLSPPFAGRPHLDLYHPLRRLYRAPLARRAPAARGDGRLASVERDLAGIERGPDLSGSLAPAAWQDFLAGRAHRLEQVFEHNRRDVLALVSLLAHLGAAESEVLASGERLPGPHAARALGLARLAERRGDRAERARWLGRALERSAERDERRVLALELAAAELAIDPGSRPAQSRLEGLLDAPPDASSARAGVLLAWLLADTEPAAGEGAALAALERAARLVPAWLAGRERERAERSLARLRKRLGRPAAQSRGRTR
jgi:uncharacterized protein YprB with RNaseH-like and TPR domain